MADNPNYQISQTFKSGVPVNDVYILAHASRNVQPTEIRRDNPHMPTSSSSSKGHSYLNAETHEAIRSCALPSLPRSRLPLNMIVSKPATRKKVQETNRDPLEEFDISSIRKFSLEPPVREKEMNRRKLQSAYLHNKRKIEEIQAMKAKLKCPQYDPAHLVNKFRRGNQQNVLSQSENFKINQQKKAFEGCQRLSFTNPHLVEPEDSFTDVGDSSLPVYDQMARQKENFTLSPARSIPPTTNTFVWNPVILPVDNRFSSAKDLLDYHYPSDVENNSGKDWFDSPGNCTTSSASSGLTVAEETVRLTYYAGRGREPLEGNSRVRRRGSYSFRCDPFLTATDEWLPHSIQPDFLNYYEE